MPILILMLMILSEASFAEDFRALNLGKSCEGLMPKEMTIGGNYNYDYVADYEYAFTTEFMGKTSSVIYKCSEDNVLKEGV